MRDSMEFVRGRVLVARLGVDAYCLVDCPGAEVERLDLTGSMVRMVGQGYDMAPLRTDHPRSTNDPEEPSSPPVLNAQDRDVISRRQQWLIRMFGGF